MSGITSVSAGSRFVAFEMNATFVPSADIAPRDALAPFPDSGYKSALLEAVDFCIARAY